ncbi:MAG: hypothetical protein ACOZBL_01295 [Patescibacteria group bacterium]
MKRPNLQDSTTYHVNVASISAVSLNVQSFVSSAVSHKPLANPT